MDSTVSDSNGKFSITFIADGNYIDYGLELGVLQYGGYVYNDQTNYIVDYVQKTFKFNYSRNITNAVVRARELNYTKLALKVLQNPYDSLYVRTSEWRQMMLVRGQSIDTTILLRHLPNEKNRIEYFTKSSRDTAGAAPGISRRRMIIDTFQADLSDTFYISKTILNSSEMPRQ